MDSDRGDGGGKLGGAGVKSRDGHRSLEFFGVAAPNAEGPDEGKGRGVPEGRWEDLAARFRGKGKQKGGGKRDSRHVWLSDGRALAEEPSRRGRKRTS